VLLHSVRGAIKNIDSPSIRLPSRNIAAEILAREHDAAVVLRLEFIIRGFRVGAAPVPKLLDELLSFFFGKQSDKRAPLLRGNQVTRVFG
jgi:hypothetical protein